MRFSSEYYNTIKQYKKMHVEGTPKLSPDKTFAGSSLGSCIINIKKIIEKTI